jgi:hypothetical protein
MFRSKGEERQRVVLRIQGRGRRVRVEVGVRRRQASHDNGRFISGRFMVEGIIGVFGKYC